MKLFLRFQFPVWVVLDFVLLFISRMLDASPGYSSWALKGPGASATFTFSFQLPWCIVHCTFTFNDNNNKQQKQKHARRTHTHSAILKRNRQCSWMLNFMNTGDPHAATILAVCTTRRVHRSQPNLQFTFVFLFQTTQNQNLNLKSKKITSKC